MLARMRKHIREKLIQRLGLTNHCAFGCSSFAQEGEDVLLWRLMDRDHSASTYVDVGCNHPMHMTNTAFFYERGWRGIAIDPNPDFADQFSRLRPEDQFVCCGVGLEAGELSYSRFEQPLYNTFDPGKSQIISERHSRLIENVLVPVRPLKNILDEIWPDGKKIRLLSVDCEGYDIQVVESHDFQKFPVEFACVEVGAVVASNALCDPVIKSLESEGFVCISKLCKSAILIHRTVAAKWGVELP